MKVSELIKELKKVDGEFPVVVSLDEYALPVEISGMLLGRDFIEGKGNVRVCYLF